MRASRWRGVAAAALCTTALAAGAVGTAEVVPEAEAASPRAGKSIIGGRAADISRWPFQAAILRKGRLHCGGSVIAPTKVLTAAHCALGFSVTGFTVVIGRSQLSDTSTGEAIPVISSAVHPDYANTFRHDLAVLTLGLPTTAPAIGLPTPEQSAAATLTGTRLRVAGFGARHPLGFQLSKVLLKTTERVRTNKRCRRAYRSFFSGPAMICAMGQRLRRYKRVPIHSSACSGDSGGPLVADTPTGPIVVGTVSFGSLVCGFSGSPTVYARVGDALPFIQSAL